MGQYLGVQIYGCICITLWGIGCALAFFLPCHWMGWIHYHPVIELLGANRFKMAEISRSFLKEIREFAREKDIERQSSGEQIIKGDDVRSFKNIEPAWSINPMSSAKVHSETDNS